MKISSLRVPNTTKESRLLESLVKIEQVKVRFSDYGKSSKILNIFPFSFSIKCWILALELTKRLSKKQTGKTLIRLKQSDLGPNCLSRLLWQAITV